MHGLKPCVPRLSNEDFGSLPICRADVINPPLAIAWQNRSKKDPASVRAIVL